MAAATIAAAWLAIPTSLPIDDRTIFLMSTLNELVLQRYIEQHASKPVVFAGSSIQTAIPPVTCRPDNVASLHLQGGSPTTGIETILRVGARPKVLFVEAPTARSKPDTLLLGEVFRPVYWRIRAALPPLGGNRNWIVMIYRSLLPGAPSQHLQLPPMSLEEWNKLIEPRFEIYRQSGGTATFSIEESTAALAALLLPLRQQGTRVILHSPIDPRLNEISPTKEWLVGLKSAFSDLEWFEPPSDLPIYRWDGIHLTDGSGLHYFDYLMKRAGLPYEPKCPLPAIFGRN